MNKIKKNVYNKLDLEREPFMHCPKTSCQDIIGYSSQNYKDEIDSDAEKSADFLKYISKLSDGSASRLYIGEINGKSYINKTVKR